MIFTFVFLSLLSYSQFLSQSPKLNPLPAVSSPSNQSRPISPPRRQTDNSSTPLSPSHHHLLPTVSEF